MCITEVSNPRGTNHDSFVTGLPNVLNNSFIIGCTNPTFPLLIQILIPKISC